MNIIGEKIKKYATIVFDCDGVILNSNKVKTQAFYQAALPYGESEAQALVDFHVANGGVSRYKKFNYFSSEILASPLPSNEIEILLSRYAEYVRDGLLECDIAEDLEHLRTQTNSRWLIVSGGDQSELREVFKVRGLAHWFDGGIFGSPDTKDEILNREQSNGNILKPSLFVGDSKYDHQASTAADMDFIFLSGWSEVKEWDRWCQSNSIARYESIKSLIGN